MKFNKKFFLLPLIMAPIIAIIGYCLNVNNVVQISSSNQLLSRSIIKQSNSFLIQNNSSLLNYQYLDDVLTNSRGLLFYRNQDAGWSNQVSVASDPAPYFNYGITNINSDWNIQFGSIDKMLPGGKVNNDVYNNVIGFKYTNDSKRRSDFKSSFEFSKANMQIQSNGKWWGMTQQQANDFSGLVEGVFSWYIPWDNTNVNPWSPWEITGLINETNQEIYSLVYAMKNNQFFNNKTFTDFLANDQNFVWWYQVNMQTVIDPQTPSILARLTEPDELSWKSSRFNVGAYDKMLWLGINGSKFNQINIKDYDALKSYTPEQFISLDEQMISSLISIELQNTPKYVISIDNLAETSINLSINKDNGTVDITLSAPRSFKPNRNIDSSTGTLRDSKWIKNEKMETTLSLPISLFNDDSTSLTTSAINGISVANSNLALIKSTDLIFNLTDAYVLQIKQWIIDHFNEIFNNFPTTPSIDNIVDISIARANPNTDTSINLTVSLLGARVNGIIDNTKPKSFSFNLLDLSPSNTNLLKDEVDGHNIGYTSDDLSNDLQSQEALKKWIVDNANNIFYNPIAQLSVSDITNLKISAIDEHSVSVNLIMVSYIDNALSPKSYSFDLTNLITSNDLTSTLIESINISEFNFSEITNENYSYDVISNSVYSTLISTYMNDNYEQFIINPPSPEQIGSLLIFNNINFELNQNNQSELIVSFEYLQKFGNANNSVSYQPGSFVINGFNQKNTQIKNEYALDGIKINGLGNSTIYSVVEGSNEYNIIKQHLINELSNLFINYPQIFIQDNQKHLQIILNFDKSNQANGMLNITLELNYAFINNQYQTYQFNLDIYGFKGLLSNSTIKSLTAQELSNIAIDAGSEYAIFSNLSNAFNFDLEWILTQPNYETLFRQLLESNPNAFFDQLNPLETNAMVNPNNTKIKVSIDNKGNAIIIGSFRMDLELSSGWTSIYREQELIISNFNMNSTSLNEAKANNYDLSFLFIKSEISAQQAVSILNEPENLKKFLENFKLNFNQVLDNAPLTTCLNIDLNNILITYNSPGYIAVKITNLIFGANGIKKQNQEIYFKIGDFSTNVSTKFLIENIDSNSILFQEIFNGFSIYAIDWYAQLYSIYTTLNPQQTLINYLNNNIKSVFMNPILTSSQSTKINSLDLSYQSSGSDCIIHVTIKYNGYDEVGNIIDNLGAQFDITLQPLPTLDEGKLSDFSTKLNEYIKNNASQMLSYKYLRDLVSEFIDTKYSRAGYYFPNACYNQTTGNIIINLQNDNVNINSSGTRANIHKDGIGIGSISLSSLITNQNDISLSIDEELLDITTQSNGMNIALLVIIILGSITLLVLIILLIYYIIKNKNPKNLIKAKDGDVFI